MSAIYAPQVSTITSVANVTALAGFGTGLVPGSVAYSQATKSYFTLDPTSTAAPDGTTIVAATGGGNWLIWDTFLGLNQVVPFTFNSGTVILGAIPVGTVIEKALVTITSAFNSLSASITVGTIATPGLVLRSTDVFPAVVGQYESTELVQMQTPDVLQMVISPVGSTQGAGTLLYNFRQNG